MKKHLTQMPQIILVGLSTRTNNKNEMQRETAKIGELASRFWQNNLADQVSNRTIPGTIYSVYTDYESDEHGDYTYFIGKEVDTLDAVPIGFQTLAIPIAKYQKFTTSNGKMPDVVINAWQQIWKMTSKDFEGERAYQADFEIYDQRASDPDNTSLDIYIGIK